MSKQGMAGRHQMNSSAATARKDFYSADTYTQHHAAIQNVQQTSGHVDFSFRKRLEKIDWRKIGTLRVFGF